MRIKASYSVAQFRARKKTEEDIDRIVKRGFKLATQMFIQQIDENVPVTTGMAKGAFSRLARYAGASLDLSSAEPKMGYLPDGTKVWKDAKLGESQATAPPYLRNRNGRYSFKFESRVFHYLLRDFNYIPTKFGKPTPWNSFEYASQAFAARLQKYLRRNLSKVLIPTIIITEKGIEAAPEVNTRKFR